ncbi:MAG: hypothetical protein M3541_09490 [Acidobacteriota bacterium]|jgi:hypothetical protein|nr:hypothetical protein [Acidobacteriota bacterium]MDQ3419001.1 hypothetical protein [Acidobacteriota bacterium]
MTLAWLRRSSRAVAALLLLVSMWQLPHRAEDDEICAPGSAEAHDESKHVFTPVGDTAHPDHCAICHWLRSLNPGFSATSSPVAPADAGSRLAARASGARRDPGADCLPARAPPSQHYS